MSKKLAAEIISSQDPVQYHLKLQEARDRHKGKIIEEITTHCAIPVQSQPVKIPGFEMGQAVQMQIQLNYCTTIIYEAEIQTIS